MANLENLKKALASSDRNISRNKNDRDKLGRPKIGGKADAETNAHAHDVNKNFGQNRATAKGLKRPEEAGKRAANKADIINSIYRKAQSDSKNRVDNLSNSAKKAMRSHPYVEDNIRKSEQTKRNRQVDRDLPGRSRLHKISIK